MKDKYDFNFFKFCQLENLERGIFYWHNWSILREESSFVTIDWFKKGKSSLATIDRFKERSLHLTLLILKDIGEVYCHNRSIQREESSTSLIYRFKEEGYSNATNDRFRERSFLTQLLIYWGTGCFIATIDQFRWGGVYCQNRLIRGWGVFSYHNQ